MLFLNKLDKVIGGQTSIPFNPMLEKVLNSITFLWPVQSAVCNIQEVLSYSDWIQPEWENVTIINK